MSKIQGFQIDSTTSKTRCRFEGGTPGKPRGGLEKLDNMVLRYHKCTDASTMD